MIFVGIYHFQEEMSVVYAPLMFLFANDGFVTASPAEKTM